MGPRSIPPSGIFVLASFQSLIEIYLCMGLVLGFFWLLVTCDTGTIGYCRHGEWFLGALVVAFAKGSTSTSFYGHDVVPCKFPDWV